MLDAGGHERHRARPHLDNLVADGQRAAPGSHVVHLVLGVRPLIVD
jgi:hypothetical protein